MLKGKLTYSNVMATLAVFLSLGAGAYAVGIGRNDVKSRHIDDGTIRSSDVKDKRLLGRDLHGETLNSQQIREDRLDVSQFALVEAGSGTCNPTTAAFVECATLSVGAEQPSRLLVHGAGGQRAVGAFSGGTCRIAVDGESLSSAVPGGPVPSDASSENGFALTAVSQVVGTGSHQVTLECNEQSGDTRIRSDLSVLALDAD